MLDTLEDDGKWDFALKGKRRLFVLHYCTDSLTFLNATKAYKAVYKKRNEKTGELEELSDEVCQTCSSRLMQKDDIRLAIARLLKECQADLDDKNGYQLLKDLMILADYNPADILNADGSLKVKSLSDLGDLAKCITGIVPTKNGARFILADRTKFMAMYLQYLELVKPVQESDDTALNVIEMVEKSVNMEQWNKYAQENEAQ